MTGEGYCHFDFESVGAGTVMLYSLPGLGGSMPGCTETAAAPSVLFSLI
jgi:hypothetical protein